MAALTVPSQRIDGDFYIFLTHPNQSLDVIVGDVMGKGIPAALLGAATKSSFLKALSHLMALSKEGELPEPRDIVMLAHSDVVRHLIDLDSFVTLCYVRLDVGRRALEMVDCGHTGIVHWHGASGICEMLHGDNLPLGVREGEIYNQVSVAFEPGDLLLFFSDGITEARNPAGDLFGVERLVEYVRSHGDLEPAVLVEAIRKAVFEFSGVRPLTRRPDQRGHPGGGEAGASGAGRDRDSSDSEELRHVREFVRDFCRNLPGAPLDEDRLAALELAVNEAASNIMKHAYHGRAGSVDSPGRRGVPGTCLDPPASPRRPVRSLGRACRRPSTARANPASALTSSPSSVDQVRYYRDERGRNCVALVIQDQESEECRSNGNTGRKDGRRGRGGRAGG